MMVFTCDVSGVFVLEESQHRLFFVDTFVQLLNCSIEDLENLFRRILKTNSTVEEGRTFTINHFILFSKPNTFNCAPRFPVSRVRNLSPAFGLGIDSRNLVRKLHGWRAGTTTLCLLGSQSPQLDLIFGLRFIQFSHFIQISAQKICLNHCFPGIKMFTL